MAKKKVKEDELDIIAQIAEETGGGLLEEVGHCPYFVDSGNLALNYLLSGRFFGGGYPGGKITEVFGPPASSKSLLGWCFLAGCQRMNGVGVYLDCERSVNADFVSKAAHVDTRKLLVYEPVHIKQVESKIINVTKAIRSRYPDIPICFVWDSIGVSPTEREWSETGLPEKCTKEQFKKIVGANEQPGERAKAAGKLLRKIQPFIDEHNATLFIINQIRNKIGVLYGDPETGAGGGSALPYYISSRIRTSPQKIITDAKRKIPIGINLKFKNRKSRFSTPFMETEGVQLYFEKGVNPLGGLLTLLIAADRVEEVGKNKYQVKEPWATGKEVVFTGYTTKNEVPVDLLLQCPQVVDMKSEEEVKTYLSQYGEALAVSNVAEEDDLEKLGLNKDDFDESGFEDE